MNTRQIQIFLNFSKIIRQFVRCLVRFENASEDLKLFCFAFCNKNNFMFALTFANLTKRVNQHCRALEIFEENIDLSRIN